MMQEMKQFVWVTILLMCSGFVSMAQVGFSGDENSLQNAKPNSNIYEFNPSTRWVRELKNVIIVAPKNEQADTFNIQSPKKIYVDAEGLTISAIKIVRLKPFGTSVNDSITRNVNFAGRAANTMHVNSNEFIIRNALLFREGDLVESVKLAYSERYLRSLRHINDVRIVAFPVSDDEAEVIVAVQDIFPYSAGFGTNFLSNANLSITNSNIIGLGLEMQAGVFVDTKKEHLMGFQSSLRSSNIKNSFVSFQADYMNRYENQRYGFTIQRDFFTPTTKYAGHLIFESV